MSKAPRGRPHGHTAAVKAQARRARQLYRHGLNLSEIGRALGVSRQWASQLLGSVRKPRYRGPTWTGEEDALLGTAPDQEIAVRLRRPVYSVKCRRVRLGIPSWHANRTSRRDALLGQLPDQEIAERFDMGYATVRARRAKLGIPNHAGKMLPPRRAWPAAEDALLGTMPDAELAARLGRSRLQVFYRRRRLGVPAYRAP